MTNLTPPSASADNEQEDELGSIIAYINGCTRKPDGTLFLAQADYLKNLIDHHTKEAVLKARIDECKLNYERVSKEACKNCMSWPSVIAKGFNERLAELAAAEQKRGGDADRS